MANTLTNATLFRGGRPRRTTWSLRRKGTKKRPNQGLRIENLKAKRYPAREKGRRSGKFARGGITKKGSLGKKGSSGQFVISRKKHGGEKIDRPQNTVPVSLAQNQGDLELIGTRLPQDGKKTPKRRKIKYEDHGKAPLVIKQPRAGGCNSKNPKVREEGG